MHVCTCTYVFTYVPTRRRRHSRIRTLEINAGIHSCIIATGRTFLAGRLMVVRYRRLSSTLITVEGIAV